MLYAVCMLRYVVFILLKSSLIVNILFYVQTKAGTGTGTGILYAEFVIVAVNPLLRLWEHDVHVWELVYRYNVCLLFSRSQSILTAAFPHQLGRTID